MQNKIAEEANKIVELIRDHTTQEKFNELVTKLNELNTTNENTKAFIDIFHSFNKTSTLPLNVVPTTPAPKWLWLAFYVLVIVHVGIVLAFITSFFVLPVLAPWYIAVPCMTFIWFFSTTRVDCQLTNLENVMRKRLGLRRIGGFVGHYFLRPAKAIWGKRRK
jgi:hypothetical protein